MPAKTRKTAKTTKATPAEPTVTEATEPAAPEIPVAATQPKAPALRRIPVDRIEADPNQPRKEFTGPELKELATSMTRLGQLQPIILRPDPDETNRFIIVVGERRWRAAQLAKMPTLNAVVMRGLDGPSAFVAQVAENVIRQDMNPLEEAAAYAHLLASGLKAEQVAELIGKSPAYIGWRADLIGLIPELQELLRKRQLPLNTAWYACKLAEPTQREFLKRWVHGDFAKASDAEAFAKACKAIDDQGALFTPTPEVPMTAEEKEKVRKDRKKLLGDFDRLAMVGELLLTLSGAEPADLAKLLAGADGGVGAYLARIEHLAQVAGRVVGVLRKAQAIAAATALTLDLDGTGEAEEAADPTVSAEAEAAEDAPAEDAPEPAVEPTTGAVTGTKAPVEASAEGEPVVERESGEVAG